MFTKDLNLQHCDFGHSCPIETELKHKVGTRGFQAPEMLKLDDTKSYKAKESEVYAFGCTLFAIMFHSYPFD